jgi:ankyrin repeat protein
MAMLALASCRKGGDHSSSELKEAGYELTAPDWMRACAAGDPQVVRHFLDAGFAIETKDAAGDTGAHAAATAGRIEVLEFLLNRKLPVDVAGANQRTPLMAAVLADQPDTVRWLLRQGADANARDGNGFSPLMLAVREGRAAVVEELAGASRDQLDDALLLAALVGQSSVIDPLTSHGASVFARMNDGRTPLMLAAQNGHLEAAEMLLELGSSRYSTSDDGRTAADFASDGGFPDVQMIIESTTRDVALSLDGTGDLIQNMTAYVDLVAGTATPESGEQGTATPAVTDEPVVLLEGAGISTPVAGSGDAATAPPLVMRHYQQRELPIRVAKVEGASARLEITRGEPREIEVTAGQVIPETTLEVVKVYKLIGHGKLNDGNPIEIAVVDVRDTRTGGTRTWFAGQPAGAHEPAALVEDAATGRRYLALQGQRFTESDGSRFIVTDVRPNQLVITDETTGTPHTLPLRGPRG